MFAAGGNPGRLKPFRALTPCCLQEGGRLVVVSDSVAAVQVPANIGRQRGGCRTGGQGNPAFELLQGCDKTVVCSDEAKNIGFALPCHEETFLMSSLMLRMSEAM